MTARPKRSTSASSGGAARGEAARGEAQTGSRDIASASADASPRGLDVLAGRDLPMRAFSKSLPMELLRAREAVMRRFRPGLRRYRVTEQQWRILRALAHAGPLEAGQLAGTTCVLASSLSRILPDMEKRQLISRRQADSDLRRSLVRIEQKGLRLIAMHAPDSEKEYTHIAKVFGEERLDQLFRLLRELEVSLGRSHAPAVGSSRLRVGSAKRAR